MPRLKVVHLSSVHHPFDTRIYHRECRSLVMAGYDVTLVAPHAGPAPADGVVLRAVPPPAGRLARFSQTIRAVYRAAWEEDAWLYHFHDPELIPVGLALKARGRRVVYDVHEDVPRQILSKPWLPDALRAVLSPAAALGEGLAGLGLDGFVAATPPIAARFPAARTQTVQNFPRFDELAVPDALPYAVRPMQIGYVGNLTAIRGAREMVAAMGALPERLDARLSLAGDFSPPSLATTLATVPGWERVSAMGFVDRAGVRQLLATCRVGLVLFHPVPNHLEAQPNKLFEYMAAGVPVLASDFPLWREIVATAGCGLLVDPLDPRAIAEALTWLLEHPDEAAAMGERGREAIRTRYNWETESRKLVGLYERFHA